MTTGPDLAAEFSARRAWQLLLLPTGRAATGRTVQELARRDLVVDAILGVVALLFGAGILISSWHQHTAISAVVDVVIGSLSIAALFARRNHPAWVAGLVVIASAVSALASGPALVALFSAAIRLRLRTVVWLAAAEIVATAVFPLLYDGGPVFSYPQQVALGALMNLVAVSWGLLVGLQRRYLGTALEHGRLVQIEQDLLATTARDAERRRIAGEMHDVLAHRLSLLSLHAGALEFRGDLPADTAREMAGVIRQASHDALAELHGAIGALRDGSEPPSSLHPQPGLDELDTLIDESRAVGTPVSLDEDVDSLHAAEHINQPSGRTVYRVVQECLTNARKHAPGSPVRVSLTAPSNDRIAVTVRSHLMPDPHGTQPPVPGSGAGLIGLAERVAVAGGEFRYHPVDGEFIVEATLPWAR